ncbi:MAG TPA: PKD domain-containing protein, partial [Thermoplasmata archaeon]|nr:PKD domain-containing protein [Thermoplasmata archaeon]
MPDASNRPTIHLIGPSGPTELASAQAALAHGGGPAASPAAVLQSPGGFSWTNATGVVGPAPSGRIAAMSWDASDGYVLLYGWDSLSGYIADTWSYANGTWTNLTGSVTGSPGAPQEFLLMAFDPSTQKVVMYSPFDNSTWTYHAKVWTNITTTAGAHPPSVAYGNLVADSTDGELVYWGGALLGGGGAYNYATWTFKNGAWSNISALAPFSFGRIIIPQAADDPMDHGLVVVGIAAWHDATPYVFRPATFLFSANHWTNVTPTVGQEPRMPYLGVFAYVPSLSAAVMEESFSVNTSGNGTIASTTWEYSRSGWLNVSPVTNAQPDTGLLASGAVDPVDNSLILFGGERVTPPSFFPSTWIFSSAPNVTASASRTVLDAGQAVTLSGVVSGGASPRMVHWTLGDGGSSSSLTLSHVYTRTGLITATLSVTDLVGHVSTSSVSLYVSPALSITVNATPTSPAAGTFVALSSQLSGGTSPYTFAWTLGDNSTSRAPSLGHTYHASGTYRVHLTVSDAAGSNASTNLTVVVQNPASTSVNLSSGTGLGLLAGIIVLLVVTVVLGLLLLRKPKGPGPMSSYPPATPPAGAPPPPPPPAAPPS